MSMGALGDSFYEYLLKAWLQANKEDNEARQMFDDAMQAVFVHMLRTSPSGLMYFAELKFDRPEHKMDHLGCFSGNKLLIFKEHFLKVIFVCRRWSSWFGFQDSQKWAVSKIHRGSRTDHENLPRILRPILHQTRTRGVQVHGGSWGQGPEEFWKVLHPEAGSDRILLRHVPHHQGSQIQGVGMGGCPGMELFFYITL